MKIPYYVFMILFIVLSTSHSLWIPYGWLMDSLWTIYRSPTNSTCSSQYVFPIPVHMCTYMYVIFMYIYIYM